MSPFSYPRYLEAKISIDDRSLNHGIIQALISDTTDRFSNQRIAVLDLGAGTGVMLKRLANWGIIRQADYTAVDSSTETAQAGIQSIVQWAAGQGVQVKEEPAGMSLVRAETDIRFRYCVADIFDVLCSSAERFDLIVAHAVLDLVDLDAFLPLLHQVAKPGGLVYLSVNFDGLTVFQPTIDEPFDEHVMSLYHRSMDERQQNSKPAGHSRTGRKLLTALPAHGFEIKAAGASDWIVFPTRGKYPNDEAFFLECILDTIADQLAGHPELNPAKFQAWLNTRREQIRQGQLVYLAHQIDFLAVRSDVA